MVVRGQGGDYKLKHKEGKYQLMTKQVLSINEG
jgi:hypothetical protein